MIETGALMRLNASSASMVQQTKQGQQHARGALQSHQHPPRPKCFHAVKTKSSVEPSVWRMHSMKNPCKKFWFLI
jgi:hypothetical protein